MMGFIQTLRAQWQLARLEAARNRFFSLLERTPRYWRSITIGGDGARQLGRVTLKEAQALAAAGNAKIAYIDLDGALITLQGDPRRSD